jgi:branched-chain amino acid transport system substrate-binding protein
MQEEPPPLKGHAGLEPVLRKALAKDREDRYGTCAELVVAAAAAIGLDAPRVPRRDLVPPALRRRGRLILAGGLVLLGATVAAAIAALGTNDGAKPEPLGNGVAAVEGPGAELASFTATNTPPSTLAVGEGAVWVLSLDDRAVTRIDPETKKVVGEVRAPGVPQDIAAGAGAVWVLSSGGDTENITVSLSRVDPRTLKVTRTVKLPEADFPGDLGFLNWGFPQIAIGAGAVWAINPDRTVSRIDPATGKPVAKIDVDASTIAAGSEGVWFIGGGEDTRLVTRINPSTNRAGQRIRVGAQNLSAIAVGAGSVWASAEGDGLVWRIEPGPSPIYQSIDAGVGVTFLSFGAGALWSANYRDGTVSRIDVETNGVEATPVSAVQGLAAGEGSAWVSSAGATTPDGFPAGSCGELLSGGADPDVLIASDLPLQASFGAGPRAMEDAIRSVLEQRDFKAGKYAVGYRSCDDSNAQSGNFDRRTCAANANAYARADDLVALIGTYNSACAQIEIPILNRAPVGPLAMISPANSYPGLTRPGLPAPWGYRGEPDVFYPTGARNFVRVVPLDDMLGTAHALLAEQLGLRRVYVIDDGSDFWKGLLSDPFRYAAKSLRVGIAGSASNESGAASYDALANDVARSGAQGVVLGGDPLASGIDVLKALRARLGTRFPIMAGFYFATGFENGVPDLLDLAGPAAHGIYVTTSDLPRAELELTPAAEGFLRDFGEADIGFVLEAAQATELVLDAIARSDGTRDSVLEELQESRVKDGLLGSFRFDRNGDISPASVPILRVTGSTPPGAGLPSMFQGAVLDRVVEIPPRLLR